MTIKSINHVGIRVHDMEKAAEFYSKVFGFKPNPKKLNWLLLENGQMVHLMPGTSDSDEGRDIGDLARHFALEVDSLEATAALLLRHGLKPFQAELNKPDGSKPGRRDITDTSDLTYGIGTIFVEDPDGNIIEFIDPSRGIFAEVGI